MLTKQQIVPTLIENRNYFANHEVYYGLSRKQIKELRKNMYEIRERYFTRMMEERDRYEREEKSTGWNALGVALHQIDDYLEKGRSCSVVQEQPRNTPSYWFTTFFVICLVLLLWFIISFSN